MTKTDHLPAAAWCRAAGALLGALCLAPAHAAPAHADLAADFHALAQQRPWTCAADAATDAGAAWPGATATCAWQDRLRMRTWRWDGDAVPACIGRQARWWTRAQAALPPAALRSVWDTRWSAQTLRLNLHPSGDGEERLLLLQRDRAGGWQATEWRWVPNPRPATRRWQQARWQALVDAVGRRQPKAAVMANADAAAMAPVLRRALGARPGELGPDGLAYEAAGLCLRASNPLPGQPKLALSYSPNDSRLEQRAAMHLQLSRLHPDVEWLTQFKLLDMPSNLPSGAKFLATWVERGQLRSQLWMPAKGNARTVRVLMTAPLPHGRDAAATQQAKAAVERELEALAVQWAAAYE